MSSICSKDLSSAEGLKADPTIPSDVDNSFNYGHLTLLLSKYLLTIVLTSSQRDIPLGRNVTYIFSLTGEYRNDHYT